MNAISEIIMLVTLQPDVIRKVSRIFQDKNAQVVKTSFVIIRKLRTEKMSWFLRLVWRSRQMTVKCWKMRWEISYLSDVMLNKINASLFIMSFRFLMVLVAQLYVSMRSPHILFTQIKYL